MTARDVLCIRGIETRCVVGVYPHERGTPQPLCVDLELRLDTDAAARSERLSRAVDYDAVAQQTRFILDGCRFRLIETAAHALAKLLLAPPAPGERRSQVASVRVRLTKPDALGGHGVPSLEIERDASWASVNTEDAPFGALDVIHQTRETGIFRLTVEPGRRASLPAGERSALFALTDGMVLGEQPLPAFRAELAAPGRSLENRSRRPKTVLLVCAASAAAALSAPGASLAARPRKTAKNRR